MTGKNFTKKMEDFICENCGNSVSGDGYTNHCPKCLYSRHVDINPGDRGATCKGLMKPIAIEQKRGNYVLLQECIKCGHLRKNKISSQDDMKQVVEISKNMAETKMRE